MLNAFCMLGTTTKTRKTSVPIDEVRDNDAQQLRSSQETGVLVVKSLSGTSLNGLEYDFSGVDSYPGIKQVEVVLWIAC